MEVYEAKYSYNQEAESVLNFNVGEKFYILGRPSDKWWFAKRIVDNLFGYVPAAYLQPAKEKVIGKLLPIGRRESKEYNIHLKALAEIHRKVKPLPAHVIEHALTMESTPTNPTRSSGTGGSILASRKMITIEDEEDLPEHLHSLPSPPLLSPPAPDYDLEDDELASNDKPYHHQLNISGHLEAEQIPIHSDDEAQEVKPKPLVNPVVMSKERLDLHRELKQSGRNVLGQKSELSKVFRDRKITEKKKEADKWQESRRTSMEVKLSARHQMIQKEENKEKLAKEGILEIEDDALTPEFAKLKLRQTTTKT